MATPNPTDEVGFAANAEDLAEDGVRAAGDDRARPALRRRAGLGPGDLRGPAHPAPVPGAAAGLAVQGGARRELPRRGWGVPALEGTGADFGGRRRRRDRGAVLPDVLPGPRGSHVLAGRPVRSAGAVGRGPGGRAGCLRAHHARRAGLEAPQAGPAGVLRPGDRGPELGADESPRAWDAQAGDATSIPVLR